MSDIKAKAEERRAKILARQNKKVSAIPEEIPETTIAVQEVKPKERPLAARRQHIQNLTPVKNENSTIEDEPKLEKTDKQESPKANTDDPEIESLDDALSRTKGITIEEEPVSAPVSPNTKSESKKEIVYTKKTLKEIEAEVAENTAKFDEKTMKSDAPKKTDTKTALVRKPIITPSNIQPTSVMRFIRLLIITAIGVYLGYETVLRGKAAELQHLTVVRTSTLASVSDLLVIEKTAGIEAISTFDEFATDAASLEQQERLLLEEAATAIVSDPSQGRSWIGWAKSKVRSQFECAVTAVGLTWWVSGMISPIVQRRFKTAPAANSGGILKYLLNLWATGFEDIFEIGYSVLGELALHVAVLILAVLGFTLLYSGSLGGGRIQSPSGQDTAVNEL